jgi:hypothetical protein
MHDGSHSAPPRGSHNRVLNLSLTGTGGHFKELAVQIGKDGGQRRLSWCNSRAQRHDHPRDRAPIAERIANRERVADRHHIRIEKLRHKTTG